MCVLFFLFSVIMLIVKKYHNNIYYVLIDDNKQIIILAEMVYKALHVGIRMVIVVAPGVFVRQEGSNTATFHCAVSKNFSCAYSGLYYVNCLSVSKMAKSLIAL